MSTDQQPLKLLGRCQRTAPLYEMGHSRIAPRPLKSQSAGHEMVYAGLQDKQRIQDLSASFEQFDASGKEVAVLGGAPRQPLIGSQRENFTC